MEGPGCTYILESVWFKVRQVVWREAILIQWRSKSDSSSCTWFVFSIGSLEEAFPKGALAHNLVGVQSGVFLEASCMRVDAGR
jgi:hypothetical protein